MVQLREIFTENRFPIGWKLVPVLIYFPLGIVLATIRFFIAIQAIIAASLLYKLPSIRLVVLRIMCGILGILVIKENDSAEDDSVKIIVSNHITIFDHLVIHLIKNSISVQWSELPSFLHFTLGYKNLGNLRNQEGLVQNIKNLIDGDVTIDIHPEFGITSGKKGLLRFASWPCELSHPIQPVVIRTWRHPLLEVSTSVLNTSWSSDIFWFFFVPFTVFKIKFIPVIKRKANESPEEMSRRLEKMMAEELKIKTTNFTYKDKVELEKRLSAESNVIKTPSNRVNSDTRLVEMASKVKEVLPDVPVSVICKDLARTKNVDLTITNFLEGLVRYTPEKTPPRVPASLNTVPDKRKSSSFTLPQPSTSFDTSSKTFHKSAQERMISFQERKLRLIQSARQRYMEKHALNVMNSS